ncbi:hypothetical protein ACHAPV_006656 [Trichoderma viride]
MLPLRCPSSQYRDAVAVTEALQGDARLSARGSIGPNSIVERKHLGLDPSPQRGALQQPIKALLSSHGQALLEIESSRKQPSRKHRELAKGLEGLPLQQKTPPSCCACCQICFDGAEHNSKPSVVLQRVYISVSASRENKEGPSSMSTYL